MMAEPTGYSIIENENLESERRVFLVRVFDVADGTYKEGLDIYDNHNSLVERIGYTAGDDRTVDMIVPLSVAQQRYMTKVFRSLGR